MVLIRRVLGVALFVGLLLLGWNFASTNGEPVSIHYVFGITEPRPVWLVVILAWLIGLGLAGGYFGLALLRDRIEMRRLRKAVLGLEGELRDFRNKPIDSDGTEMETKVMTDSRSHASAAEGSS